MQGLAAHCLKHMPGLELWQPPASAAAQVEQLVREKYANWAWNYGRSPAGALVNSRRFAFGAVEIHRHIKEGRIAGLNIYGDFFGDCQELEKALLGARLKRRELAKILNSLDLENHIQGMTREQLLEMLL